ncbi:MAG: UPF0149 family protein [Kangiellaceae bacterium]|nr:UPF0149 family protein [Kangiellaceae bacterium]
MSEFEENSPNWYESFEESLANADCEINASEFQGVLAGMISAGLKQSDDKWLGTILEVANDGQPLSEDGARQLKKLYIESHKAFREQEVLAPILLPGEDYPLVDRIESLSLWSQGYLLGFGLQLGDASLESPEVSESLQDISEIAQLDLSADDSEESQVALLTLIEHIKVAVKVVYLELVYKLESVDVKPAVGNDTFH